MSARETRIVAGLVWAAIVCLVPHAIADDRVGPRHPAGQRWLDGSGFSNAIVAGNGTTLHAIDYGGEGPAMVFLAGLGNSAHVFDDFAPRFRDAHRVVALTRRGTGESGRPKDGYDTATLAEDVRVLLDSLGIERAVLVGHSVAGDEMTEFAARYPARAAGLIYIDAAYDRSRTAGRLLGMAVLGQLPPAPPGPSGRDRASLASAGDYLERLYGVRWPASEVAATRVFDARGRWSRDATSGGLAMKVMRGETAPRWSEVRAPALALFAVDREEARDFPWIRTLLIGRGAAHLKANRYRAAQARWERGERERLTERLPAARIVEIHNGSHYLFCSNAERVEREMRSFVEGLEAKGEGS